ncbi:MAG: PHP domain-containing protein [Verrucomicrobiota bacterium]|nr:PHP domain-containing protein [Verrucomicrobiota bacterium]
MNPKEMGWPMRAERPARDWFVSGSTIGIESWPAIDFQMHTRWTDGRCSVKAMIDGAQAAGLSAIAITEHLNSESTWYPNFVAEVKVERLQCAGLEIYFGAEVAASDYLGGLKADVTQLEAELVLGVVHRYPKPDGRGFWVFEELTGADAVELELRALAGLATNRQIDVLGHPGGTAYKRFGPYPVEWLEPAFRRAREHGIAVELNTKYLWDLEGMLALLRKVDPLVSFGSDAHAGEEVGSNYAMLRRHGAGPAMPRAL